MRICVELSPVRDGIIALPVHYNRALQGMIYNLVKDEAPEIHDRGYLSKGRTFRLFVFSRLTGDIKQIKNGKIYFIPPVKFKIDSPVESFINTFAGNLLKSESVRLGDNLLKLSSLYVDTVPDLQDRKLLCKAISPITVYSTLKTEDGRKKTYYYHPQELEFAEQVRNNILKKAGILGVEDADTLPFNIKVEKISNKDQKVVYYGNTVVKGWMGIYRIQGDPKLMEIAYTCGVGSKNSQGFGMIETLESNI